MNLNNLFESAIDELEKRRIEDLEAKMDDLHARARKALDAGNSKAFDAYRQEFMKAKAERDSYHYVREENIDEHGGGGGGPAQWHAYVKAHRTDEWSNSAAGEPEQTELDLVKLDELSPDTLKSYADKRGSQVAAMKADNPNPTPGSDEWSKQAVPAQKVGRAKQKIARAERQGVAEGNPNSDPWYVYAKQNPQNFKKFKTYDAAKAYAEKHGLTCASAGHFHDRVSVKGPQGVDEGWQNFNKVEPYAVCLAGKPIKKFDYYEEARRFHDNWKQKLYREGNMAKAEKITLMPLGLDEADQIRLGAVQPGTSGYDAWYKSTHKTAQPGEAPQPVGKSDYDWTEKQKIMPKVVPEGAKVDRMVKHIEKSEKELGHSKKDAESIAWATANKRGYLDNTNKKKHTESINFVEWAVAQGSRFSNFTSNPAIYAAAKAAYLAEGMSNALSNITRRMAQPSKPTRAIKNRENKKDTIKRQHFAEDEVEEDCWKGYKQIGMKDKGGKQVPNCVPTESQLNDKEDTVIEGYDSSITSLYNKHSAEVRLELASNHRLYENREDYQTMREFLDTHKTSAPEVGDEYAYVIIFTTPVAKINNIAHFSRPHKLVKLENNIAYFEIDHVIRKFPETGSDKNDSFDEIYFFKSMSEFNQFKLLFELKFPNQKTSYKKLDSGSVHINVDETAAQQQSSSKTKTGSDLKPGEFYIWEVYFDDGTKKRIKVTKDHFDPKAYYAKKNQVVINVKYDWTVHNG